MSAKPILVIQAPTNCTGEAITNIKIRLQDDITDYNIIVYNGNNDEFDFKVLNGEFSN